ncbi:MAG: hypothetical protein RLZZ299_78 [Pseudomonadota bacterium]|jgi:hypothetical protein
MALPGLVLLQVACDAAEAPPAPLPPLPPRVEADALPSPGPVRTRRHLVIAVTGEVRGEVEPCGCPTTPYGGFARRQRLLDGLRAEGPPVFVLDAGEMLVKALRVEEAPERRSRARAVLDLARRTGLDAWAASPVDLEAAGPPLLKANGALAAGWDADGLPARRIVERNGVRLGVIGLPAPRDGAAPLPAARAVTQVRAAMNVDAEAWVVLSNAGDAASRAVAEGVPGLAAVIATRGESLDAPYATSGAPVVEVPDRGRYVTVIRAALGTDPGPLALVERGPLARLSEQRGVLARQSTPEGRAEAQARVEATLRDIDTLAAGRNLAHVETRPLGSDLDGPSAVDDVLADWRSRSTREAEARAATTSDAPIWAGSGACARCHTGHLAAWTYSPHANAWNALQSRGQGENPECLGCHTTAWGAPGGYGTPTPAALRTWKGVQCEACHGPLGAHPEPQRDAPAVTEATCRRCHDAANSPNFDYATYLARVSCVQQASREP